ncbi:MAG: hypothetical protein HUU57_16620 [Bdellovibrio sp.]|nr:hypothetical protein [Bdellovibrio sp.]
MFDADLGDCCELNLESLPLQLQDFENKWKQYNPRKNVARWGLSITSLDGQMTGEPDLDSLREYNRLNGTKYNESDFRTITPLGEQFRSFSEKVDLGRSHIIKLGPGGYFPYHRDLDWNSFRVIYCIEDCQPTNFVWITEDKVLPLQNNKWYVLNTKKVHSTFSFNGCKFAVFNVIKSERSVRHIVRSLAI